MGKKNLAIFQQLLGIAEDYNGMCAFWMGNKKIILASKYEDLKVCCI